MTFTYKVVIYLRYRKVESVAAEIITVTERSNCVDLAVFITFALNSGIRVLAGYSENEWNSVSAELAIALRLLSVSFSLHATRHSDKRYTEFQKNTQDLVNEAHKYINPGENQ